MRFWIRTPQRMEDLSLFARHVAGAVEARTPMPECLAAFVADSEGGGVYRAVKRMIPKVSSGVPLWEAMSSESGVFPGFVVGMVRVGEQGGILATLMNRLADTVDAALEIFEHTRRLAVYPLVLLSLLAVIVGFIFTTILPKFVDIYIRLGAGLPGPTLMIVRHHSHIMLALLVPLVLIVLSLMGLSFTGVSGGRFVLSLPFIGPLLRRAETARFASTLGLLLEQRIPLPEALAMLKETSPNGYVRRAMEVFEERAANGESLSVMVSTLPIYPAGMAIMLAAAEDQGNLAYTLVKLGDHYAKRARHGIGVLREGIEPLMMVFAGLFVGIIVISLYLPLFNIVKVIR